MNKNEAVALELTKLWATNTATFTDIDTILENYKYFLKEVDDTQRSADENSKLQKQVKIYLEALNMINHLMTKNDSNVIFKEDVEVILGGIIC